MNVKELKERLSKMPEDLPVWLSDERNLTISSTENVEVRDGGHGAEVCVISGTGPDLYGSR